MPETTKRNQPSGPSREESQSEESQSEESSDLKEREYRGPDGEVHHHTKKYMEQHPEAGKAGKKDE